MIFCVYMHCVKFFDFCVVEDFQWICMIAEYAQSSNPKASFQVVLVIWLLQLNGLHSQRELEFAPNDSSSNLEVKPMSSYALRVALLIPVFLYVHSDTKFTAVQVESQLMCSIFVI